MCVGAEMGQLLNGYRAYNSNADENSSYNVHNHARSQTETSYTISTSPTARTMSYECDNGCGSASPSRFPLHIEQSNYTIMHIGDYMQVCV